VLCSGRSLLAPTIDSVATRVKALVAGSLRA